MSIKIKFNVKSGDQIVTELTPDEIDSMRDAATQAEAEEKRRPLSFSEVQEMLVRQQINTLTVDDNTALRMVEFYPEWSAGQAYTAGYKAHRGGKLWRCLQAHTAQTGWEPENAASLWTEICESHDGTMYDPIPYNGNMALQSGKYYTQNNILYLCNRSTGQPVYNALAELVGLYVEVG